MARRTLTFTDLKFEAELTPARKPSLPMTTLGGVRAWTASEHARVIRGEIPCPVCSGNPPVRHYCLLCDSFFIAPGELPGEPIDSRLNDGWDRHARSRVYVPDSSGLGGGRGSQGRPSRSKTGKAALAS